MVLVLMFLQLDVPQNSNSVRNVILYGFRWVLCFILVELMTHLFYYNAFANRWVLQHSVKHLMLYSIFYSNFIIWQLKYFFINFIQRFVGALVSYGRVHHWIWGTRIHDYKINISGSLEPNDTNRYMQPNLPSDILRLSGGGCQLQFDKYASNLGYNSVFSLNIYFYYVFVSGLKLHVAKVFTDLALFQVLVTGMLLALLASKHKCPCICGESHYFGIVLQVNGIEVPENMPKCINNCHNLEGFWKNWHASFNKWLVRCNQFFNLDFPFSFQFFPNDNLNLTGQKFRYVYIPLGGSRKKLLNVWVIFTFVAIWHDLEWYAPFIGLFNPFYL